MEKILIADSNVQIRTSLRQSLLNETTMILEAETGKQALEYIRKELPEVVIVDVMLPDMTGFQVCQQLLNTPQSDLVYIIMLTPVTSLDHKVRGIDKGADEYLLKTTPPEVFVDRVRAGLEIIHKKRENVLDPLSVLYKRTFFQAYFAQEVSRAQRYHHSLAFILGEIDQFQRIARTYGQSAGDAILAELGMIFRTVCRRSDLPVRWDDEQFAILAHETDLMGGMLFADRIRQAIEAHQFLENEHLTMSFGVALLRTNREDLVHRTEKSLQDAKKNGGNKVVTSTQD